mmetsp:Transcript_17125/g.65351  ORF Transcript_17125/g.65351 Transcript_17125/m.65351 type:complete len:292 (+) Transcript_17125:2629-3504(+)
MSTARRCSRLHGGARGRALVRARLGTRHEQSACLRLPRTAGALQLSRGLPLHDGTRDAKLQVSHVVEEVISEVLHGLRLLFLHLIEIFSPNPGAVVGELEAACERVCINRCVVLGGNCVEGADRGLAEKLLAPLKRHRCLLLQNVASPDDQILFCRLVLHAVVGVHQHGDDEVDQEQRHEQQHQDVDQLRDGPGIVNRIANPVAISQDELLKHVPKDAPEASHFCFGELHEEGHSEGDPEHEEEGEEDAHVARHSKDGLNVWTDELEKGEEPQGSEEEQQRRDHQDLGDAV